MSVWTHESPRRYGDLGHVSASGFLTPETGLQISLPTGDMQFALIIGTGSYMSIYADRAGLARLRDVIDAALAADAATR